MAGLIDTESLEFQGGNVFYDGISMSMSWQLEYLPCYADLRCLSLCCLSSGPAQRASAGSRRPPGQIRGTQKAQTRGRPTQRANIKGAGNRGQQ